MENSIYTPTKKEQKVINRDLHKQKMKEIKGKGNSNKKASSTKKNQGHQQSR